MIRVTGDQPSRRLYALLQEVTGDNAVNILYVPVMNYCVGRPMRLCAISLSLRILDYYM